MGIYGVFWMGVMVESSGGELIVGTLQSGDGNRERIGIKPRATLFRE